MNEPNYILKATEAVLVPAESKVGWIKKAPLVIVGIIVVASILFQENIFMEMSVTPRFLLIGLVIWSFTGNNSKWEPSEFEIRFYDEYLEIYREKRYTINNLYRKCCDTIYYKDIKKCHFRKKTSQIIFFGYMKTCRYNYRTDGTLESTPVLDKYVDTNCFFYTGLSDVDFIKEIEEHSPIKVEIRNS